MSTPNGLFLEYLLSLKRPDVEELADLYLFRPLAFLLVKAIYRTPLTPNHLSVISMSLGIGSGLVLSIAGPAGAWAGAVLLFFAVVVDCSDGQLARLKHNGTHMGRVVDGVVDYVVGLAVYLGLGLGFLPVVLPGLKGWLILAAAGASNMIHSAFFDYYRIRYLAYIQGLRSAQIDDRNAFRREYVELGRRGGQELKRKFIRIYLGYTAFQMKISRDPMTMGPIEPETFRKANRFTMRLWTFLGSSTQAVLLIVMLALGRLDLYFWAMIVVLNAGMIALFLAQSALDFRVKSAAAAAASK
jgi:hypothetical protein